MIDTFFDNCISVVDWFVDIILGFNSAAPLIFVVLGTYLILSLFVWFLRHFIMSN